MDQYLHQQITGIKPHFPPGKECIYVWQWAPVTRIPAIKIGYTSNLFNRLYSIEREFTASPGYRILLHVAFGTRLDEDLIRADLQRYVFNGREYFLLHKDVVAYIDELRSNGLFRSYLPDIQVFMQDDRRIRDIDNMPTWKLEQAEEKAGRIRSRAYERVT